MTVATATHTSRQLELAVRNYDLAATLASGQAFRWRRHRGATDTWDGVIHNRWVRLRSTARGIAAEVAAPPDNWDWLSHYLQAGLELEDVLRTFPQDPSMQASMQACRGLRLLRQDPWECLVSFICSSTKQIVQIEQIIELLCVRWGNPLPVPAGVAPAWSFPSPEQLAAGTESALRACKMGFRAPYVLAAAKAVAGGALDLGHLGTLSCGSAREVLTGLPGVGPKIANCVLLFAYGFQEAFPVDVWVRKALRELYFPKRAPSAARLERFIARHFGPNAGYAQQYLFHFMRTAKRKSIESPAPIASNHGPQL
jgi:N-glycosylase/DNA lyase